MIVVDSGVWIDYFTGSKTEETKVLDGILGKHPIGTSELIYGDVLQRFELDRDVKVATQLFALLSELDMVTPTLALKSAEYARKLRKKGISITSTVELMVATFCVENDYPMLYTSRNYLHFEENLNLRNVIQIAKQPKQAQAV